MQKPEICQSCPVFVPSLEISMLYVHKTVKDNLFNSLNAEVIRALTMKDNQLSGSEVVCVQASNSGIVNLFNESWVVNRIQEKLSPNHTSKHIRMPGLIINNVYTLSIGSQY